MQQNYVFLLNADKTFLNTIHLARARELQSKGKAAVFRVYPYVLILKNQVINPLLNPNILKIDAACVGESGANITIKTDQALSVKCIGHGNRQARCANAQGFPAVKNAKAAYKHVTADDIVKLEIHKARKNIKQGMYTARVKTPTAKGFEVVINGFRIGVSTMKDVKFVHRNDGYGYEFQKTTIHS